MSMERMVFNTDNETPPVFDLKTEKENLNQLINDLLEFAKKNAKQDNGLPLNYYDIQNLKTDVSTMHLAIERCLKDLEGSWGKKMRRPGLDYLTNAINELETLVYRKNNVIKALNKLNKDIVVVKSYFNNPDEASLYLDKVKAMMNSAKTEFDRVYKDVTENFQLRFNAEQERQNKKSEFRKSIELCLVM